MRLHHFSLAVCAIFAIGRAERLDASELTIKLAGDSGAQIVFDASASRCENLDIPDAPTRIFRDSKETIHLISSHERNREIVGKSFEMLQHTCRLAFVGLHSSDPSVFSDRQWLASVFSYDGSTIYAIAHDEFYGHLRPALCPSLSYGKCWYNALTFAKSTDLGYTFSQPSMPERLIASIPYRYDPSFGRPVGYFQPSNMVQVGASVYFGFFTTGLNDQKFGVCFAKSHDVSDPSSWRGWGGNGFVVKFADPYSSTDIDASLHVCTPVGKGSIFDMGSLSYDLRHREFFVVSYLSTRVATAERPAGVYMTQSKNLSDWTEAKLIAKQNELLDGGDGEAGFVSLIDHNSDDRNFGTISENSDCYLYYVRLLNPSLPNKRVLERRQLSCS